MPQLTTSAYEVPVINTQVHDSGNTPYIMAEEGGHHAPTGGNNHNPASDNQHKQEPEFTIKPRMTDFNADELRDAMSPTGPMTPNPFSRKNTSIDIDDYFTGPRDILKHSKWPLFMQMHGSILPKMIVPLIWMCLWSAAITCIDKFRTNMGVDSVLLTVLGFVVGLGLSFRSSTAYERYAEGRRYWAQLILATQSLGRVFWIHGAEAEGVDPRQSLLRKILNHISCIVDKMVEDGQLKVPMQQTLAYNNVALLNDIMTGTERVLTTPLPIAYTIAISQITWVYVMLLPFQLIDKLDWITIPATVAAAYIILGILFIGREIENPFGEDVNDLPLEAYCEQIASELDIIASFEKRDPYRFMESSHNLPLFPASMAPYHIWMSRSEDRVRDAIKSKHNTVFEFRKKIILEKVASRAGHPGEKKPSSEGTATLNGDHNV
ncbi:UPF0187 protein sll1024 [Colletotrichum liriopes]|uniref:UPF0187 protein sll1024 n=1 Tax=Colletotrichum liriopes TaxID=708192 RepID=A0AA37GM06_9PEZI|nr:UPF0187 protein sll1024 [Colletotrichum liriopes]